MSSHLGNPAEAGLHSVDTSVTAVTMAGSLTLFDTKAAMFSTTISPFANWNETKHYLELRCSMGEPVARNAATYRSECFEHARSQAFAGFSGWWKTVDCFLDIGISSRLLGLARFSHGCKLLDFFFLSEGL